MSGAAMARLLLEGGAVRVSHGQPFILAAGWASPAYIDCRLLIGEPRLRRAAVALAVEAIRAEHGRDVGTLVLSQYVETTFALSLVADGVGGSGYLLKDRVEDLEDFADAVRRIARGGSVIDPEVVAQLVGRRRSRVPLDDLTQREREILRLLVARYSDREIAEALFISYRTVTTHVANIFDKLGVNSRREAAAVALQHPERGDVARRA